MSDIVDDLRYAADDEIEMNASASDLLKNAANEIARLHGVNDRLRAEIERLRAMVFRPFTLTDAEREAVETSFDALQYAADELGLSQADCDRMVATLRSLLERTEAVEK